MSMTKISNRFKIFDCFYNDGNTKTIKAARMHAVNTQHWGDITRKGTF